MGGIHVSLGLILREEFRGKKLKGTQIELANDANSGATQITAQDFLAITYPTHDLLKGIEAIGPGKGRPVVIIGERGQGKSHLMAALYHAVNDAPSTKAWLDNWATTLGDKSLTSIQLRKGMKVIGASLHQQRYKFLWDLLFEMHPHGTFIKGKWEGAGSSKTNVPSDQLIVEMLTHTPVMLLLDEFQTWYDGLTNTAQYPWKNWAFNFIQILSEIADKHPELLVFVVSVRNGGSDAYQQIHRVNPVQIDFKAGGSPERIQLDRRRMLLHRLFQNRLQLSESDIEENIFHHISEYFRLLNIPSSEHERKRRDFIDTWPFAPHLLQLLEDQVLVATDAQETRDLIRILANLFKSRGETTPLLTAADFRLDDDGTGIGALLDSVANQQHRELRERAMRNITSVMDAVPDYAQKVPHLIPILSALWLRSIAIANQAGADRSTLQIDITQTAAIDDNAFEVEMAAIVENSFNIHNVGSRLVFKGEENPQAKLMASARNDRLFTDGSDKIQLAKEIKYVLAGDSRSTMVIPLPQPWRVDPWSQVDEADHPDRWDDRLPLLVLPEVPDKLDSVLGMWLKDHLQKKRNTVRFLLPRSGTPNIFTERDILVLTRAEMKAREWSKNAPEYNKLVTKFQTELRDIIKKRYDRFSVLRTWNFAAPEQCSFSIENVKEFGAKIPSSIEDSIKADLFEPEYFEEYAIGFADENASLGKMLRELQEPRPSGSACIPWLGEVLAKEQVLLLCAKGKIAIDNRGMEYLQALPGELQDVAWSRLKSKLSATGRQLDDVKIMRPSAVPVTGATTTNPTDSGEIPNPFEKGSPSRSPTEEPTSGKGGSPFSGGTSPKKKTAYTTEQPTSALNLIGKLEIWGVTPATPVSSVSVKLSSTNGAQLKDLLKKLPDGLTYELSFDKEEFV